MPWHVAGAILEARSGGMDRFGFKNENRARGDGSHWFDPEMRPWVSGGHGALLRFN